MASGDELLKAYGLAPVKPPVPIKPATTGTKAGPVKMRPGPGPQRGAMPALPGAAEHAAQVRVEGRLDRSLSADPAGPPVGRPSPPGRGIAPQVAGTDGPDMAALRAMVNPAELPPTPQAAVGEPMPRTPMYNARLHGSPETYAGLRQAWSQRLASPPPPGPEPLAVPEPGVPGPGMLRGAGPMLAKNAGLGLMFNAVNDPHATAAMFTHPGDALQGTVDAWHRGLDRIGSGDVGAGDLVQALGQTLGMPQALGAGVKMGQTIGRGVTDPAGLYGDFRRGLGVIGNRLGF